MKTPLSLRITALALLTTASLSACDGEDCSDPIPMNGTVTQIDINGDGKTDITITVDGNKTTMEHDLDGDGIPEIKSYSEDSNGDGQVDITRTTVCAKGQALSEQSMIDLDNDGKWDISTLKIDTDGDGTLDYEEHRRDTDGNGVPEELFTPLDG
jgi:hypothetical protein